jgi:hypothetical protein
LICHLLFALSQRVNLHAGANVITIAEHFWTPELSGAGTGIISAP